MSTNVAETVVHEVRRLVVPLNASYEEAVRHYERLAPVMDAARLQQLQSKGVSWDAVVEMAVRNAPLGFMHRDRLRVVGGHDQANAGGLSRAAVRQARHQLPKLPA